MKKLILSSVVFFLFAQIVSAIPLVIGGKRVLVVNDGSSVIVVCNWQFWKKCTTVDSGGGLSSAKLHSPIDDNLIDIQGTISGFQILEQNSDGTTIKLNNFIAQ